MKIDLTTLDTEKINKNSVNIDVMDTNDILKIINNEDKTVAYSVEKCLSDIQKLIDSAYENLLLGGRIIYIGAGTSGRLGILDASECPPTFGVEDTLIQGLIAGGFDALFKAKEGAEDSLLLAKDDLKSINLTDKDTVIGLAASGRTPYVIGGIDYANSIGALTGSISCVNNSEISKHSKISIEVITGAEVITGSTRMKAGTAEKMVLNMISTTLMIKIGKVYHNLMIDVQPTNKKLEERARNIICMCTNCDVNDADEYLIKSNYNVKIAICMILTHKDFKTCNNILIKENWNVSKAIRKITKA